MGITFTPEQQNVIDLRGEHILVSAAAGSGKTAVLTERIVKMISDEAHPVDIDRLLVVTFTNAAAAEMRERISRAIDQRLEIYEENEHLQKQSALIHNAQITTIDSFCLYLIRNHFNDIGLAPGFRVAEEGEIRLLMQEVMDELLEERFARKEEAFLHCVEYFSTGSSDKGIEEGIWKLYQFAESHPWPEEWLEERKKDYEVSSLEQMDEMLFMKEAMKQIHGLTEYCVERMEECLRICEQPDGPYMYGELLEKEKDQLEALRKTTGYAQGYAAFQAMSFGRLPGKKDDSVSPQKRAVIQEIRKEIKDAIKKVCARYFSMPPERALEQMQGSRSAVCTLVDLVLEFKASLDQRKREENILDFSDMEHLALSILIKKGEDGQEILTDTAMDYREYFHEILIDEYQDSNLVQEKLLQSIAKKKDGQRNCFMVGDVKQSIYKFRLARPELFLEKYDAYTLYEGAGEWELDAGDVPGAGLGAAGTEMKSAVSAGMPGTDAGAVSKTAAETGEAVPGGMPGRTAGAVSGMERKQGTVKNPETAGWRIDLHKNFRSRKEVVDSVNYLFERIMQRQLGGIDYDAKAALYPGASYPEQDMEHLNRTELLLIGKKEGEEPDAEEEGKEETGDGRSLSSRKREAQAVASRIRELVGRFPVTDAETGELRPAAYKDIVILFRATSGWDEDFKSVLKEYGIPVHTTSRTGYFSTGEVQVLLQLLQILDNPLQDIPLYGVMKSFFGGFTDHEAAWIRGMSGERKQRLYLSLKAFAGQLSDPGRACTETSASQSVNDAVGMSDTRPYMDAVEVSDVQPCIDAAGMSGVQPGTGDGTVSGVQPCVDAAGMSGVQPGAGDGTVSGIQSGIDDRGMLGAQPGSDAWERAGGHTRLQGKVRNFLEFLEKMRDRAVYMSIHELLQHILNKSGYLNYVSALPAGEQRRANVQILLEKAAGFEKSSYYGLFHFNRYMEQLKKYEVDYGEANILDEHADVVRIMSIHKSKGLEFPICFVCGLAKRFNMRDTSGKMIVDADMGIGVDYVDPVRRFQSRTIRKHTLGEKMRLDNLGEELRILYVALTRAKEKLIMTGMLDKSEKKIQMLWAGAMKKRAALSYGELASASSFLDMILNAMVQSPAFAVLWETYDLEAPTEKEGEPAVEIRLSGEQDVIETEIKDRLYKEKARTVLVNGDPVSQGNPDFSERIEDLFSYQYSGSHLERLYTKTTVSELKKAGTEEEENMAFPLYEKKEVIPYLPRFMAEEETLGGTGRGSAFHKVMELLDLQKGSGTVETQMEEMEQGGRLSHAYREAVSPASLEHFLDSRLAQRMKEADQCGKLYREQPFVLGIPANELEAEFPAEELVLIQGIIDVYFEEADGLVVADYKTDRVRHPAELVERYRKQLEYYARALEQLTGKRVKEQIIYSFCLEREIALKEGEDSENGWTVNPV